MKVCDLINFLEQCDKESDVQMLLSSSANPLTEAVDIDEAVSCESLYTNPCVVLIPA